MSDLLKESLGLQEYAVSMRRKFHQHPEAGFKETWTSNIVAEELRSIGLDVTTGIAGTGVVAMLEGKKKKPVVLLRFDMDALPVQEETGAEYASTIPGMMHACGHDGHMAVGLSVAKLLKKRAKELNGTVKFVFQPAEEGDGGAERMVAEGVLDNPKPDFALAIHLWNEKPVGWVALTPGPIMAGSDTFTIRIIGIGGHGGIPHLAADPVLAAAQIITALQSIVARNISPLLPAVISVTKMNAGKAINIIPSTAEIAGSIRSFDRDVRLKIMEKIGQIAEGVSHAMGCTSEVDFKLITPPVVNNEKVVNLLEKSIVNEFPEFQILKNYQTTVSEDMSFFLERIPGCYLLVGSANPEKRLNYGHHHPKFDFDEAVLPRATALIAAATLNLL